jgi:hypothetical protein
MNAEQYRALVNKLEAITEAGEADDPASGGKFPSLKIGDIDPRNGQKILSAMTDSSGNVVRSRFGDIWNVKYGPADVKPDPTPAPVAEPVKVEPVVEPVKVDPVAEPDQIAVPPPAEEKCGPEVKEKIKQQKTFNAAYAMARRAGCPDFDWCQIVTVPQQGPKPAPQGKVDFVGQQDPLGGDDKNPMSFAPNSNFGAEEGIESDGYILEDELNRVREIAGTQVVREAGEIPEIKAASKAAAIEIARKKGIRQFRFCGKYKVKAGPQQGPKPTAAPPSKVDWLGQQDPLGGDDKNPMSFAPNSNFGA